MSISFEWNILLVVLVAEEATIISGDDTIVVFVWKRTEDERLEDILSVIGNRRLC